MTAQPGPVMQLYCTPLNSRPGVHCPGPLGLPTSPGWSFWRGQPRMNASMAPAAMLALVDGPADPCHRNRFHALRRWLVLEKSTSRCDCLYKDLEVVKRTIACASLRRAWRDAADQDETWRASRPTLIIPRSPISSPISTPRFLSLQTTILVCVDEDDDDCDDDSLLVVQRLVRPMHFCPTTSQATASALQDKLCGQHVRSKARRP